MLWLAVESATVVASVAIGTEDRILAEITSHSSLNHSERLLPMVDQALALAGKTLAQVDRLVVSAGPGSFTGLRIGLSTVKGFAHARAIPVYLVSTLEGMAWQQPAGLVVPLLDARRAQVYAAVYQRSEGGLQTELSPTAIALTELLQRLDDQSPLFVGEGASLYRQQIIAQVPSARFADEMFNWPRAAGLALLAWRDGRPPANISSLNPDYIRASSAEQQRAGANSPLPAGQNEQRA